MDNHYPIIGIIVSGNFRKLCAAHGLALTHQRQVIWETLNELPGHPTPEVVYERVRERIPSISLATVYKNVKAFIEHGLLREVSLHHGLTRLETNAEPHHHLICTQCREIVDVREDQLDGVRLKSTPPEGFEVHRYSVEVLGICRRCSRQGRTA